jgi:leucyl aminopeptidase
MDLHFHAAGPVTELTTPLLVVPVLKGEGDAPVTPGNAGRELAGPDDRWQRDLRWQVGSSVVTYGVGGPRRVAFLGIGTSAADLDRESIRRFAGAAVRLAETLRCPDLALLVPQGGAVDGAAAHQAAAEGLVLGAWRFRELKTGVGEEEAPAEVNRATLVPVGGESSSEREAMERGRILAEAENLARMLQSRPGNLATPSDLAEVAEAWGAEYGLEVEILGPDRIREERMGALLAVAQGSAQEPRLILLRHRGGAEDEAPLVLVGKGLTFDAGGISLKPPTGMEDMKFDMSGGAAVLAAMTAVARLDVPRNVVGVVPSSENLLGAAAVKPGDVVTTRAGITVEIVNTDAEGRLILCDALDYVTEMAPEAVVDCATLTGAVVVGLGNQAMAVLGTDDDLVDELREVGEITGERCWPLPLWPEYRKQLKSETADVKNVGGRPAGTITAAMFLRQFVKEMPWAHLDIAGTAYGDGGEIPYRRAGGYGVPTRLLAEWVLRRSG